jgi:uncharacterized membrane protein
MDRRALNLVHRLIAAAGVAAGTASAHAQAEYECIVVDAFAANYGVRETYLWDISDQGVAVGTTTKEFQVPGGTWIGYTGFYWTQAGGKVAIDLSWPKSVNNTGLIGGSLAVYDRLSAQLTPMPLLPSTWPPLEILGVNDAGVGVGYVQTCNCSNSQGFLQKPYVWDAMNGARSLAVPAANGARRINNQGQVVGWIGGHGMTDGFVYDLATNQYMLVSSLFPGTNVRTTAMDINDHGVVVGSRLNFNGSIDTAYTWSPSAGVTLLPFPPAGYQPYVRPTGINDSGVVVGSIYTTIATQLAFVYDAAHGVRDLNALTTAPAGFTLMSATAVNDQGWIVGIGYGGGGMYKAFVLKPLGGTCYADCNADGALSIADFGCFQARFVAGDPYADCNAGGTLTIADFGCFQSSFAVGCP